MAFALCSRFRLHILSAILLVVTGSPSFARQVSRPIVSRPVITKVDPPNWWVDMPNPMLLVHGENLGSARFKVEPKAVTLLRSQISQNGRWAFLWLDTQSASAQTLHISAVNSAGAADFDFPLGRRKPATAGFQGFSSRDVMYLIMTDRFADGDTANDSHPSERALPRGWHGGDFRGIEEHLDYLQQLGVTTVWTTPAYDNSGGHEDYHGYSATDMYAVDPHFGTLADYEHLAQAMHARGMKLVLDTVPNHVGPSNPWATDPPAPDWFHGTVAHHEPAKSDFRSLVDPYASWAEQRDVTEGWFANMLPDLNQENPLVKQYLIQNAVWWVESAGLDGLRLDTFPYVDRAFWHDFHAQLKALYPRLTTVGEIFNPDPRITSYFAGGVTHEGIDTGLYTPFDFPTYFMLGHVLAQDQPMSKLEDVLSHDELYPHPERLVTFFGNHDTVRFLSQPGATVADLKLAFGLIATLRGMPQIYSGDEIAMRGGVDPDNRRDFPGGFPGDKISAFTAAGRTGDEAEVFDWTSRLMRFRSKNPALLTGQQQDIFRDASDYAFVRGDVSSGCTTSSAERVLVVVNHASHARTLAIPMARTALAGCSQFAPALDAAAAKITGDEVSIPIATDGMEIYLVR